MTRWGMVPPRSVDAVHLLVGVLDALLDGGGHFVGLAVAPGDLPSAVADDDQGVEAEPAAALDHRRAAADGHDAFAPLATVALTICRWTRLAPFTWPRQSAGPSLRVDR